MKKKHAVFIFIFYQLTLLVLGFGYVLAAVVNRGSEISDIAIPILYIGFLLNIALVILLTFNKFNPKVLSKVMSIVTLAALLIALFGSSPIRDYIASLQLKTYKNIQANTQGEVLGDTPIEKEGRVIGIRVELKVTLPEKHVFTSRLSVRGFTDSYNRSDMLMRMLSCGDIKPYRQCRFWSRTDESGKYHQGSLALDEEDYQTPFWASNFDDRLVRKIYFELVPASGESARSMKEHGTFQVSDNLLDGSPKELPLSLWLNSGNRDYELTTVHVNTRNLYNLREMFINSGREEVLKEILTPNIVGSEET